LDGTDALNANQTVNIWTVQSDGSGLKPITRLTASGASISDATWSPDGSKIVFASARALDGSDATNANLTVNIWTVQSDGSGFKPITKLTASGANSSNPTWSPDGSKIVFASAGALDGSDAANATLNIWVANADGSGAMPLTRLTPPGGSSFQPAWSPDGSKIAFSSPRALDGSNASGTNEANIWVINSDGSGAVHLTAEINGCTNNFCGHPNLISPAWSPDGSKVLFVLTGAGTNEFPSPPILEIVNSDGSGFAVLTSPSRLSATPAWSPDGAKIALASSSGSANGAPLPPISISIMLPDGSGLQSLTGAVPNRCLDPAWSPDGSRIAFSNNDDGNIWLVNANGSGITPITNLTAGIMSSGRPRWRP